MVSPTIPLAVTVAMVAFTIVSYLWRVKVSSYLRFMIMVTIMICLPLFILVYSTNETLNLIVVLVIEVFGLLYIGTNYRGQIGAPYQEMYASMVRIVDNKDMDIPTISRVHGAGEMNRLQDKQLTFINSVRTILRQIQNQQSSIDGYLENLQSKTQVVEGDLSQVTSDVDEILQNVAIISERIEEIRNQSVEFIDRTNSNFDLLVEISNATDRITDQTNIIAVNAAIEAAQTKTETNFGVVADGIQSLSRRSRETTDRLFTSINNLRRSTVKEIKNIKQKLDQLEEMILDIGEQANRSSGITHTQQSNLMNISSISTQAKEANEQIGDLTSEYKID